MNTAAKLEGSKQERLQQLNAHASAVNDERELIDPIADPDATPATEKLASDITAEPARTSRIQPKAESEDPEAESAPQDQSSKEIGMLQRGFANNINDLGRTISQAVGQHTPILNEQSRQLRAVGGTTNSMLAIMLAESRKMDPFKQPAANEGTYGPAGEKEKDDRKNYDQADFSSTLSSLGIGAGAAGAGAGALGYGKIRDAIKRKMGIPVTPAQSAAGNSGNTGSSRGAGTNTAGTSPGSSRPDTSRNTRDGRRNPLRGKLGTLAKLGGAAATFMGAYALSDYFNGEGEVDKSESSLRLSREETDARLMAQSQGRELTEDELAEVRFTYLSKHNLLPEQQAVSSARQQQEHRVALDPEYAAKYNKAQENKRNGNEYDRSFDIPKADLSSWTPERRRAELVNGEAYEEEFGGSVTTAAVTTTGVAMLTKKLMDSRAAALPPTANPAIGPVRPSTGLPTPDTASPTPSRGVNSAGSKVMKVLGKAAGPLSTLLAAVELGSIWDDETLTQEEKQEETANLGGGLAGSLIGGKAGAAGGAALGSMLGSVVPILGTAAGAAVGGVIGGIGGSILGYFGGSEVGDMAYDAVTEEDSPDVATTVSVDEAVKASTASVQDKVADVESSSIITPIKPFQTEAASELPTNAPLPLSPAQLAEKKSRPMIGAVSKADRPAINNVTTITQKKDTERAYLEQVAAKAEKEHGIPSGMLRSLIEKESGYNATVISRSGASGIMQLSPTDHPNVDTKNAEQSITYGASYLQKLYAQTGDWNEALALYSKTAGNNATAITTNASTYSESTTDASIVKPSLTSTGDVRSEVIAPTITNSVAKREGPKSVQHIASNVTNIKQARNYTDTAYSSTTESPIAKANQATAAIVGAPVNNSYSSSDVTHVGTSDIGTNVSNTHQSNVSNVRNNVSDITGFSSATTNEQQVQRQKHDPIKKVMMLSESKQEPSQRNVSLDDLKNNKRVQSVAANITPNITNTPTINMDFGIMAFNTGVI